MYKKIKEYFETEMGYINNENPPVNTFNEFVEIVNKLKNIMTPQQGV